MIVGLQESEIKGRLYRFPEVRAFVEEVVEEKDEWLARQFKKIAPKKGNGGKFKADRYKTGNELKS